MFFAKVVVDSVVGSRRTGSAGGFDNNHDMFNKNNKNEVCPAQSLDKVVWVILAIFVFRSLTSKKPISL